MENSIKNLKKELRYYAVCPNCDFHFGSGCAPFDPTYRPTLSKEFFDSFFETGEAESVCPRCEDPMTENDIFEY